MTSKKMRWIMPALVLSLTGVVLSGCGTAAAPAVTVTAIETVTPPDPEQLLLDSVRSSGNSVLDAVSDQTILETANSTRDLLDSGRTVEDAVSIASQYVSTSEDAEAFGLVIGYAVKYLCPEYMDQLQAYAAS